MDFCGVFGAELKTDMKYRNEDVYGCEIRCPMVITDKDAKIRTFMHYSEPEALLREPVTVFGRPKKGLFYNYSDRLFSNEWTAGCKLADESCARNTARWFEVALKRFHNAKELDLQHVLLGVNRSNGYHYLVFGYTYTN